MSKAKPTLHRHIGGLERFIEDKATDVSLHRHIGGLENTLKAETAESVLHRHIGGLENPKTLAIKL